MLKLVLPSNKLVALVLNLKMIGLFTHIWVSVFNIESLGHCLPSHWLVSLLSCCPAGQDKKATHLLLSLSKNIPSGHLVNCTHLLVALSNFAPGHYTKSSHSLVYWLKNWFLQVTILTHALV